MSDIARSPICLVEGDCLSDGPDFPTSSVDVSIWNFHCEVRKVSGSRLGTWLRGSIFGLPVRRFFPPCVSSLRGRRISGLSSTLYPAVARIISALLPSNPGVTEHRISGAQRVGELDHQCDGRVNSDRFEGNPGNDRSELLEQERPTLRPAATRPSRIPIFSARFAFCSVGGSACTGHRVLLAPEDAEKETRPGILLQRSGKRQ